MRRALFVVAITVASAAAHVSPSVDDNNRFLKLTPLGDRVRLAYTVLYGDNPARALRPAMDTDGDGLVSDAEAQIFSATLAKDVAAGLEIEVDGKPQPMAWRAVNVGMGAPQATGGTFSVDLVGYLCLASARGAHAIQLRDHYKLSRPGETEIKVEDSPGVTVSRARVGPADDPTFDYKFVGPGGPLYDDGLDLRFEASARAAIPNDGACAADAPASGSALPWVFAGLGVCAVAGVSWIVLRRRARRA